MLNPPPSPPPFPTLNFVQEVCTCWGRLILHKAGICEQQRPGGSPVFPSNSQDQLTLISQMAAQVEQYRARADESAAAAQASSARAESAEQQLRKEQARVAPLYGAHLDQLTPADLAALATVHEDGLRRIKALQVDNLESVDSC